MKERFGVQDGVYQSSASKKAIVIVAAVAVVVGVGMGLLIGHFGITKGEAAATTPAPTDGVFLPGVSEKLVQEADPEISNLIINGIVPNNIRENLRNLSEKPHVAGTPADLQQAEQLRDFWKSSGLDEATVNPYDILLSYPDTAKPNKVYVRQAAGGDIVIESPDKEIPLRPEENITQDMFSPYLAYSASGVVTGDPVYVNYARVEDFEYLEKQGISVQDTIVIARYGGLYRGDKVKFAEERGAKGVILYSDPANTNVDDVPVYPDSWWMPPTATALGSIFEGTGDPLTPGYPATDTAYRYPENATEPRLPTIPAIPVGYYVAEQILRYMGGADAPANWTGELNATYKIGPGFANPSWVLELDISTNNEVRRTYNAFGIIRGAVEPDRYVLIGNHRDSWVWGAIDPSSGTAVMMEVSRVMADLEYIKNLYHRAVAYINVDIAVTGDFALRGRGSPPLYRSMFEGAKKVKNPDTDEIAAGRSTVYDTWLYRRAWKNDTTGESFGFPSVPSVGAGSDYATFQMFAGISCADYRYDYDFSGNNVSFYPLYHTGYETFYAVDTYVDPGFKLHTAIGQLDGELLRYLSDSLILPMNLTDYAWVLSLYSDSLYRGYKDVIAVSEINFNNLTNVVETFREETVMFHEAVEKINKNDPMMVRLVNDQMMQVERAFLDPAGLPGRPLLRHLVQSVSIYNTYEGASFPGLTDSLYDLDRDPTNSTHKTTVQQHFAAIVFSIQSASSSLKDVTKFIRAS